MLVGSLFNCLVLFSCTKLSIFISKVFSLIVTIALLLSAFTIFNYCFEESFLVVLHYIGIFCVACNVHWSLGCVSFAWMLSNGRYFVF